MIDILPFIDYIVGPKQIPESSPILSCGLSDAARSEGRKYYSITVHWSQEDHCFIARHPELKNVHAHGESVIEAIGELEIALSLYLKSGEDIISPVLWEDINNG